MGSTTTKQDAQTPQFSTASATAAGSIASTNHLKVWLHEHKDNPYPTPQQKKVLMQAAQLSRMPQGQPERLKRAIHMVEAMDREGFGGCTNHYECEAVCPKEIPLTTSIGRAGRATTRRAFSKWFDA